MSLIKYIKNSTTDGIYTFLVDINYPQTGLLIHIIKHKNKAVYRRYKHGIKIGINFTKFKKWL